MALTKENTRQLIRLQEQDGVLDALLASIAGIPARVRALQISLDSEKKTFDEIKAGTTRLQLDKKEKELELAKHEEAIRKHSQDLNQVKTNEAYRALLSEIEKAKAQVGDLETAILMLMEELDQAGRDEKAAALRFKESEARTREEIQTLQARRAREQAQAETERAKRQGLAEGIPREALAQYEYVHKRWQGAAMAPVKGNMCGVCRITLTPQSLIEVARGGRLVVCESCQRILYDVGATAAPEPRAPSGTSGSVEGETQVSASP